MNPELVAGLRLQLDDAQPNLLSSVLADVAEAVHDILADTLVGVYLEGSFALGSGDIHADVDFLVATHQRPDATQEAAIRELHQVLPDHEGHWAQVLEGSHASLDDLRKRSASDTPWLYVDNGNREMEWSTHDNTEGRYTEVSVTDACMAVGVSSLGSISTAFSTIVGLSPLAYRNASTDRPAPLREVS